MCEVYDPYQYHSMIDTLLTSSLTLCLLKCKGEDPSLYYGVVLSINKYMGIMHVIMWG